MKASLGLNIKKDFGKHWVSEPTLRFHNKLLVKLYILFETYIFAVCLHIYKNNESYKHQWDL